jgi:NAD(P)-dependent dehydrogenase (short-subunit alcohol dehydrogenase family)
VKAIVTGGSAGIGLAVVKLLLEKDYDVVSLDVQPPGMKHPKLAHIEIDLTNALATERIAGRLKSQDITTVIHNAGTIRPALLPEVRLEDLNALVNLHLSAAVLLVQATLPAMKAAKYGRVVLVSSRAVLGLPTRTSYSATKAGMLGMARTWALELAPHGITVNAIAPGATDTPLNQAAYTPAVRAAYEQRIALGRIGVPEEVADATVFLASDASRYITGHELVCDGGLTINGTVGHARS